MTRVLFIGGIGRSGSTLFERVLGELPQVCALGEVANLWQRMQRGDERCGCGVRLDSCDFWRAAGDHAFGGWHNVDLTRVRELQAAVERIRNIPWLGRSRLAGPRRALVDELVEHYVRIYDAAAALTGAQLLVDSSKSPGLAFCLRWASGIDLRVVHLMRDPRGVAYSFTKQVPRPEADGVAWMPRRSPAASAVHWSTHNLAISLLARAGRAGPAGGHRVPVHRVHYERFLADPPGTVRAVGAAAGLELAGADLAYLRGRRAELGTIHSVAGNPMRFTVGEVPLRHDGAWRTHLPQRQRRIVGTLCAPLLAGYGYPVVGGPPAAGPAAPGPPARRRERR